MMGVEPGLRIIPFRGEYFSIRPERRDLVRGADLPGAETRSCRSWGVALHQANRRLRGGRAERGPRPGPRGLPQDRLPPGRGAGHADLPRLLEDVGDVLEIGESASSTAQCGRAYSWSPCRPSCRTHAWRTSRHRARAVRAQAIDRRGNLVQDFAISETDTAIHVLNAPSPGATSALTISRYIAGHGGEVVWARGLGVGWKLACYDAFTVAASSVRNVAKTY